MVDLETMGTGNEAAIVSIGAVKFEPMGSGIDDAFYVGVSLASSVAHGLKVDPDTVLWWMGAERDLARKALLASDFVDLPTALEGVAMWIGDKSVPVWGNGATFDNVILRNAYTKVGFDCPWSFRDDRCYRTLKNLAPGIDIPANPMLHQALSDATYQAQHMQAIVKHLGLQI